MSLARKVKEAWEQNGCVFHSFQTHFPSREFLNSKWSFNYLYHRHCIIISPYLLVIGQKIRVLGVCVGSQRRVASISYTWQESGLDIAPSDARSNWRNTWKMDTPRTGLMRVTERVIKRFVKVIYISIWLL